MAKVYLAGIGPGSEDHLTPLARKVIEGSDTLIGSARQLEPFKDKGQNYLELRDNLEELLDYVENNRKKERICILLSGDPCFFSLLRKVKSRIAPEELEIIPGISSFQAAFAKIGRSWQDASFTSAHGRPLEKLMDNIPENRITVILTDRNNSPRRIASFLREQGFRDRKIWVAGNISYDDETIRENTLYALAEEQIEKEDGLSIMILDAIEETSPPMPARGVLQDKWFTRSEGVPLSKAATRAMVCSLLWPLHGKDILEIGSGTGGLTVELARRTGHGRIYSIEIKPDALSTTGENLQRAALVNKVKLIRGKAPGSIAAVPPVERVVIGGHGGALEEIIMESWKKLLPGGRLLVTANIPANAQKALDILSNLGTQPEMWQMNNSTARQAGENWMLLAQNPVFLVWGDKEKNNE